MPYTYQFNRTEAGKLRTHADNTLRLRFTTPKGSPVTLEVDRSALASASKVVAALQDCQQSEGAVVTIPGEYPQQVVDHCLCLVHSEGYQAAFEVEVPLGWAAFAGDTLDLPDCEGWHVPLSASESLGVGFLENDFWELVRLTDYMDASDDLRAAVDRLWAGHGSDIKGGRKLQEELMQREYADPGRWLARAHQVSPRYPATFDAACAACIRLPSVRWLEVVHSADMRQVDREVLASILAGREIALRHAMWMGGDKGPTDKGLGKMQRVVKESPMREVFITSVSGEPVPLQRPFFVFKFPVTLVASEEGKECQMYYNGVFVPPGVTAPPDAIFLRPGGRAPDGVQTRRRAAPGPWQLHMKTVITGFAVPWRDMIPVKQGGLAFAVRVDVLWETGEMTSAQMTPPHLQPLTDEECKDAEVGRCRSAGFPNIMPDCMEVESWQCDIPPPDPADTPVSLDLVLKFELNFAGL